MEAVRHQIRATTFGRTLDLEFITVEVHTHGDICRIVVVEFGDVPEHERRKKQQHKDWRHRVSEEVVDSLKKLTHN